ncbi:histidine kinase [Croceivirga radicis]|uniref:Histidine kinase n=1 Tax=Croceivirga radicis TaxID=1929488 RepID=A0A1V6LU18_9FLAO|nr:FIST N-terminal domain-containing protein [Croceivirga radicis]OQD43671.1 histidine kinase [Croceivirga radicis]
MKFNQGIKQKNKEWDFTQQTPLDNPLVLVFGDRYLLESETIFEEVREMYPNGEIVFGSTSGEIYNTNVFEESVVITAIEFEKTTYKIVTDNVKNYSSITELGRSLATKLPKENLNHIFVVSDGSFVNGSQLIKGIEEISKDTAPITGGLCGDGARFEKTLTAYNSNPKEGEVVVIGFYGKELEVSYANYGGWSVFGPNRLVTRSKDNVLFEIDGQPALELYKKYLGEKSKDLPQAALLYPLAVKVGDKKPLVRTILNIDEKTNSMILAGDVPEGATVQLMMSTMNDIAEAASKAANLAMEKRSKKPELALLVSCVGRKLVLAGRTEEEIEEVRDAIGDTAVITGFYSYGEMAPFSGKKNCLLHNQTMTLTLMSE